MRTLVRLAPFLVITLVAGPAAADPPDSSQPGFLGILLQRVEGGLAEALDLEEDSGVLISQVVEDSPAAEAGLKAGDIVTRVGDTNVRNPTELRRAVRDHHEGDRVKIHYLRSGKRNDTEATLGGVESSDGGETWPGSRFSRPRGWNPSGGMRHPRGSHVLRVRGERGFLGVSTQPLGGDLGEYFGVADGKGALVTSVEDDSPAARLGLETGDVIVKVDDGDIDGPGTLGHVIREFREPTTVEIVWVRDKKQKNGKVELEVREAHGWLDASLGELDLDDLDFHARSRDAGPGEHRRVRVDRLRGGLDDGLDEIRQELDELRKQVEELRGER